MEYPKLHNGRQIPDVHATIYLVSSENGGRNTPLFAGYNPQFHRIEPEYSVHDVILYFIDTRKEMGFPGETIDVYLYFRCPIFQRGNLFEGLNFYLKEASRIIAVGMITKILKPEMLYWYPETLINGLKERNLKTLHEITKTNFRKELDKFSFLFDIANASQNKIKTSIFDLNFTGFYDNQSSLQDIAPQLFELWQEKFNLGQEKHKFYYLSQNRGITCEVVFEFITWNNTNYLSYRLVLQKII